MNKKNFLLLGQSYELCQIAREILNSTNVLCGILTFPEKNENEHLYEKKEGIYESIIEFAQINKINLYITDNFNDILQFLLTI